MMAICIIIKLKKNVLALKFVIKFYKVVIKITELKRPDTVKNSVFS